MQSFLKAGRKTCFFCGGAVVNFLLQAYTVLLLLLGVNGCGCKY